MGYEFKGVVEDSRTGSEFDIQLILGDMKKLGARQVSADPPSRKGSYVRYRPGTRANPINWRTDPLLRVALAIGTTVYSFYYHSCVLLPGQTSEKHMAHRVTGSMFRRRVVQFVKMVLPELGEKYGDELDGLTKDGRDDNASLWKKIYNCALYAEFEHRSSDPESYAAMYAQATMLMFLSADKLRECSITPVDANGNSRKPK